MRVQRGLRARPVAGRGKAVAIGNFDGVHLGHLAVIEAARQHAAALACDLGVVTFEPHPREVLAPATAPARLSPLRRKAELLAAAGVERLLVLPFRPQLMAMSGEDFIEQVLARGFGVRAIAVGSTFRFGHKRHGDVALLRQLGHRLGIAVTAVEPVTVDGAVCSSTRIRQAIEAGDVQRAAGLLGYAYALLGRVRQGDRRGRELGFPTANTYPLHRRAAMPGRGVYAVLAQRLDEPGDPWHPAAASIGTNPTFDGTEMRLEVHLLDGMAYDLYGRRLRVAFLERLRDEARFDSIEALVRQMRVDCDRARSICAAALS